MTSEHTPQQSSHLQHHHQERAHVQCAIITVSDTRDKAQDHSGALIEQKLQEAGHQSVFYQLVKDDQASIQAAVKTALATNLISAILLNGGTGIAKRDVTITALQPILESTLPGFGELFRMLSYQDIGPAAQLSRAQAGVANGKIIYALPGSKKAVALAMEQLILPELGHVVYELQK